MENRGRKKGQIVKPVKLSEAFLLAFHDVVADVKNVTLTDKEVLRLVNDEVEPDSKVSHDQFRQWKSKLSKDKRKDLLHPMFEQLKDLFELSSIRVKQNITEKMMDDNLTSVRAKILQFLLMTRDPKKYSTSDQVRSLNAENEQLKNRAQLNGGGMVFFDRADDPHNEAKRKTFDDRQDDLIEAGHDAPMIKVSFTKGKGL